MKSFKCNTATLMEAFGVSRQTISNYVDQGMPKLERDEYNLLECCKWKVAKMQSMLAQTADGSDLEREETRWKKAQADLQELKLAERRGELAPIDLVKEEWSRHITATKTQLLTLPSKLVARIRVAKNANDVRTLLDKEIRQVLDELSASDGTPVIPGGPAKDHDGPGGVLEDHDGPAKANDGKRVGRRKKVRTAGGKPRGAGKVEDVPG